MHSVSNGDERKRRWPILVAAVVASLGPGFAGQASGSGGPHDHRQAGPRHVRRCGEIKEPGSYVLVRNLYAPSPQSCIQISARYVTLDMNGFAIIGQGDRVPGFRGIWVEPLKGFEGIAVRNGSVHNFYDGVALEGAAGSTVEDVRVVYNLNHGISLHTGLAKSNTIWANGVGIRCTASLLVGNVFHFGNGVNVEDVFGNCTLADNGPPSP
jgi:hypothetical protein